MDDLNRRMQEARRAEARAKQNVLEEQFAARQQKEVVADRPLPGGTGRPLLIEGEHGFVWELLGRPLRPADPVEVYVDGRVGWLAGRFRWDGSPETPAGLRVALRHPDDGSLAQGEMLVTLPNGAVWRWPAR